MPQIESNVPFYRGLVVTASLFIGLSIGLAVIKDIENSRLTDPAVKQIEDVL